VCKRPPSGLPLGWYTYDRRFSNLPDKYQIVGDLNPVLVARLSCSEGAELRRMFQQVFVSLWERSPSVKDACAKLDQRPSWLPMEDWLEVVSLGADEQCPLFPEA